LVVRAPPPAPATAGEATAGEVQGGMDAENGGFGHGAKNVTRTQVLVTTATSSRSTVIRTKPPTLTPTP
jgi:hypothetical protein